MGGFRQIQGWGSFGQQNAAQIGNDRGDSGVSGRIGAQNQVPQTDAQRRQRLPRCIPTIQQLRKRHLGKFGARGLHQRLPPPAPGIQRRTIAR